MKRITILVILFLCFVNVDSWAQSGGIGGGLSYVCRGPFGKIKKALFLDLQEEALFYGRPLLSDSLSRAEVEAAVLQNIKSLKLPGEVQIIADITQGVATIQSRLDPFKNDIISQKDPSGHSEHTENVRYHGRRCKEEVVGLYDDDIEVIRENKSLYLAMSPRDQYAFELHELFYKISREAYHWYNDHDAKIKADALSAFLSSDMARRMVGILFTDFTQNYDHRLLPKEPHDEFMELFAKIARPMECGIEPRQGVIPYRFASKTGKTKTDDSVGMPWFSNNVGLIRTEAQFSIEVDSHELKSIQGSLDLNHIFSTLNTSDYLWVAPGELEVKQVYGCSVHNLFRKLD